ncbi:MAG TPA: L,D-transpeptidase [Micromonosporaceae bacterium]
MAVVVALTASSFRTGSRADEPRTPPPAATPASPTSADQGTGETLPATSPPADLPVIDYNPAPAGFPPDPDPLSTVRLGEGLHPIRRVGAYDAPGGRPLAFLAPTIRGVEVTMPIVERRAGWAAVLLPSANRTIAWVPPGGWTTVPLRDLLVIARATNELFWLRDDMVVRTWQVTLGHPRTPTPLGRTFILGRSSLSGRVYAGTDVFALGAVPDDPDALPPGLRGAHIGIHTWYHDRDLGKNVSDGCIRLTRKGQEELLDEIRPGTGVVVVDTYAPPAT